MKKEINNNGRIVIDDIETNMILIKQGNNIELAMLSMSHDENDPWRNKHLNNNEKIELYDWLEIVLNTRDYPHKIPTFYANGSHVIPGLR